MNENINLCEILKDCPKDTKLYCTFLGDVLFSKIKNNKIFVHIRCVEYYFYSDGTFNPEGECIIFPSREQRDWSKFKVPIKKFNPKDFKPFDKVLVRKGEESFHWAPHFFGMLIKNSEDRYNVIGIGNTNIWRRCIPYNDDTKHLIGLADDCPEYYKWWKK